MRILTIAKDFPTPLQPHAGIFVLRQAQALAELGHDIRVVRIVPHAPPIGAKWRTYRATPRWDCVEGIAVQTIRAVFPPRMLAMEYLPVQVMPALRRIARQFAPDVVHAHFLLPCGQLAARLGRPTVLTAHGSDAYDWAWRRPGLRRAASEAILAAQQVVAVSAFIAERLRALGARAVNVVYNGADHRIFAPADRAQARRALGLNEDRFCVAFAGRPTHEKGAFDLVQAAALAGDVRPLLLFAGAPDDREHPIACAAREAGVDLRCFGSLPHAQLAGMLAAADAFALPSYREGLPASLCEAMLCGLPAVATPVGGIPEILTDGERGYLVACGDVRAIGERLRALACDEHARTSMGQAAHRFAAEHLTWAVNARQYDALYQRARAAAA